MEAGDDAGDEGNPDQTGNDADYEGNPDQSGDDCGEVKDDSNRVDDDCEAFLSFRKSPVSLILFLSP